MDLSQVFYGLLMHSSLPVPWAELCHDPCESGEEGKQHQKSSLAEFGDISHGAHEIGIYMKLCTIFRECAYMIDESELKARIWSYFIVFNAGE